MTIFFSCTASQHESYKKLRDLIHTIYSQSDYTKSVAFQKETIGKSTAIVEHKTKYYKEPTLKTSYQNSILELLGNTETEGRAKELINVEHHSLLRESFNIIYRI